MASPTLPRSLSGTYALDPAHTRIGFSARHAMVTKVRGWFDQIEGTGTFDADDPSRSQVRVTVQAASVNTRNADRDAHLRSGDFLDADHHPEITFVSRSVERLADDRFALAGDLTIRGTTRPVTLDIEVTGAAVDPEGNRRIGLEGRATVNRRDWGLVWNMALEAGGVLVSEKVTLEFEASAVRTGSYGSAEPAAA